MKVEPTWLETSRLRQRQLDLSAAADRAKAAGDEEAILRLKLEADQLLADIVALEDRMSEEMLLRTLEAQP